LRVIAIAFLTAIAGGSLSVVASLYLTELYHVSNFEGGRGMLIFFALAPLGLIVGFLIGLVVALRSRENGFGGFARAQGIAFGIALGLAAIVSGVLYFAADHPPKLDGKSLALEFELKIPPALKLPAQPNCTDVARQSLRQQPRQPLRAARLQQDCKSRWLLSCSGQGVVALANF
jgi:MFS family permease